MKFTVEKLHNGMHCIVLDKKTVSPFLKAGQKRLICLLNNVHELHCALMSKKEGGYFIILGATLCRQAKIKAGSIVEATFSVDNTTYQFDMPEELKEVLDSDNEADQLFHALTPGNQRGLIYLVTLVKSTDKKIERALLIAEKIKLGIHSPRLVLKK
jgi:hypothetical protein